MAQIALSVEFLIKQDRVEDFKALLTKHAAKTLREEPGRCLRFDIMVPKTEINRVFLYELYADEKAFEDHLKVPIVAATRAAYAEMLIDRRLVICERLQPE